MKIFLVGDYWSETGPSNVTRDLLSVLPPDTLRLRFRSKLLRAVELLIKIPCSDAIIFSGFSVQVIVGIQIARYFKRKTFYLMHGSIEYENQINDIDVGDMVCKEKKILKNVDYILAVSEQFYIWLKDRYPEYQSKIYISTNGVDWDSLEKIYSKRDRKKEQILSSGGGMPLKNIVSVCKAIEKLYEEHPQCNIRLVVVGGDGRDTEKIKKFFFTDYRGVLPHDEVIKIMQESRLFIQNSLFETFGLAPIEALLCGCNILLSKQTGARSILTGLDMNDIVLNPLDIDELKAKIWYSMSHNNHQKILSALDREAVSTKKRAEELQTLVERMMRNS